MRVLQCMVLLLPLAGPGTAAAASELIVTSLDSDAEVVRGEYVSATVIVLNVGASATGSFDVLVSIVGTAVTCNGAMFTPQLQYPVGNLLQFQSDQETVSLQYPAVYPTGSFKVCAIVDWNDDVSESNENNNILSQPLTVHECTTNAHCEDNDVCNGPNDCQANVCLDSPIFCNDSITCTLNECDPITGCFYTPLNGLCSDSVGCTTDTCHVGSGCTNVADDANCDDDQWCNGPETCDETLDCQAGTPPTVTDDGVDCTNDSCDEGLNQIVHEVDHSNCLDLYCMGTAVCDATLDCTYPNAIDCSDNEELGCFEGSCNLTTGLCDQAPTPVPPGPAVCVDFVPHMEGVWEGWISNGSNSCFVDATIVHTAGQPTFTGFIEVVTPLTYCAYNTGTIAGQVRGGEVEIVITPDNPSELYDVLHFGGIPHGDEFDLPHLQLPGEWIATRTGPNADGDGVSDIIEDAAPNGGDGNGDGTLDSQQADVASIPDLAGTSYLTLEVGGGCSSFQELGVHPEEDACTELGVDEATCNIIFYPDTYDFPFGIVDFRLPCTTATVTTYYHGASVLGPPYRKIRALPDYPYIEWYTLPAPTAQFGAALVGGVSTPTVTLNLVDGMLGDANYPTETPDGEIHDPGGVTDYIAPVPSLLPPGRALLVLSMLGLFWLRRRSLMSRA